MGETSWNGLNVIEDEIGKNRRTFESLNREFYENQNRNDAPKPRQYTPFKEDYDFVRYQERIKSNEELKNLKNAYLAKGIITLGIAFTLVLGGTCAGEVIKTISHLFKGENTEQLQGTTYSSKSAYEEGVPADQTNDYQAKEAEKIYSEIANGQKENLTEEELKLIEAYDENQYGKVNIPENINQETNTFPNTKAI